MEDPIRIARGTEALYLLQRVRDEAHRFAISFHRQQRGARMTTSALDGVPGLGPTRRARLLKELGGVRALRAASEEDILALTWLPTTWGGASTPIFTASGPRSRCDGRARALIGGLGHDERILGVAGMSGAAVPPPRHRSTTLDGSSSTGCRPPSSPRSASWSGDPDPRPSGSPWSSGAGREHYEDVGPEVDALTAAAHRCAHPVPRCARRGPRSPVRGQPSRHPMGARGVGVSPSPTSATARAPPPTRRRRPRHGRAQRQPARNRVLEAVRQGRRHRAMQTSVLSFGYKHGIPLDVDVVFDCRFLPNP